MFELKRISLQAVARSLAKAERYRLLNEPREAESICLDVLLTDPDNHEALVMLLLSLTDQFSESPGVLMARPQEVLQRLTNPYEQHYYAGLIQERWARAQLGKAVPGYIALGWVREAMRCYEKAEDISPAGNDDAILRFNACVRMFQNDEWRQPEPAHVSPTSEPEFDDEMPMR